MLLIIVLLFYIKPIDKTISLYTFELSMNETFVFQNKQTKQTHPRHCTSQISVLVKSQSIINIILDYNQ